MARPHQKRANIPLPPLMTPWRAWAQANGLGINTVKNAIADGRLRVRRVGIKLFVTAKDGEAFVENLPTGPGRRPEHLRPPTTPSLRNHVASADTSNTNT